MLLSLCVLLQREQCMGAHCVKPIKFQPCHIASSLPSHAVNMLLSHHSYQRTCVHCTKSPPLSFVSFSNFPVSQSHYLLQESHELKHEGARERAAEEEQGKFHIIYPSVIIRGVLYNGSDVEAGNELRNVPSLGACGPSGYHQPTH